MPRFSLKSLLLATALIAVAITLWSAVLRYQDRSDPFDRLSFSATTWAQRAPRGRAPMARDLIHRHLPSGLPSAQVKTLLGPPSEAIDDRYEYYLGSWSSYGYDDAFVYIYLDKSGKVKRANLVGY
jgi:hypothetical protein